VSENDEPIGPSHVADVAYDFVRYYVAGTFGCRNCGGVPHSSTCFVGRFVAALALDYTQRDHRLTVQAFTISQLLADAGVGPCPIVEGVRAIIEERDRLRAERVDIERAILKVLNEDMSPWSFDGSEPMCQRLFAAARGETLPASDRQQQIDALTFTIVPIDAERE